MTKPVRFDEEADAELTDAAVWYEKQRAGLGRRLLFAVGSAVNQIAEHPQRCPLALGVPAELEVRQVRLSRFPYHVVYIELPEEIRVLALAHERRRPAYWRSRLSE